MKKRSKKPAAPVTVNSNFEAGVFRRPHRAVKVAVVGEGESLHAEGLGAVHQAVDPAGAIEEAVVAVDVKMDEISVGRRHGSSMGIRGLGAGKD